MKENPIVNLTFSFALNIIKYVELLHEQKKFIIANQMLRSGTSIGANVREAQNAESKNDFIHKMKIAAKEADETSYWLELCNHSESYPKHESLTDQIFEIQKVLNKIISTTKKNLNNK